MLNKSSQTCGRQGGWRTECEVYQTDRQAFDEEEKCEPLRIRATPPCARAADLFSISPNRSEALMNLSAFTASFFASRGAHSFPLRDGGAGIVPGRLVAQQPFFVQHSFRGSSWA